MLVLADMLRGEIAYTLGGWHKLRFLCFSDRLIDSDGVQVRSMSVSER